MEFSPEIYQLGTLKLGENRDAKFTRETASKLVVNIEPGCGCTQIVATRYEIVATLSAPHELPEGVKEAGDTSFDTQKWISLQFDDDTFETLFIEATITA